jgi:hypothetical protein
LPCWKNHLISSKLAIARAANSVRAPVAPDILQISEQIIASRHGSDSDANLQKRGDQRHVSSSTQRRAATLAPGDLSNSASSLISFVPLDLIVPFTRLAAPWRR